MTLLVKWRNVDFLLKSLVPLSWRLRAQYGLLNNYLLGNNPYHQTTIAKPPSVSIAETSTHTSPLCSSFTHQSVHQSTRLSFPLLLLSISPSVPPSAHRSIPLSTSLSLDVLLSTPAFLNPLIPLSPHSSFPPFFLPPRSLSIPCIRPSLPSHPLFLSKTRSTFIFKYKHKRRNL